MTEHEWESINKAWEEIARHEELQDIRRAKEKGFKKGLEEGLDKGLKEGLEKGLQQGIEQGIEKGQKELILKLIYNGKTIEEVADLFGEELSAIQAIIK